jgi:hypothetical protein
VTGWGLVLAALDGIDAVIWYSVLQLLSAEGGVEGRGRRSVGAAGEIATLDGTVLGDGDRGVMVMNCRARSMG